jgi:hypothetical protein
LFPAVKFSVFGDCAREEKQNNANNRTNKERSAESGERRQIGETELGAEERQSECEERRAGVRAALQQRFTWVSFVVR